MRTFPKIIIAIFVILAIYQLTNGELLYGAIDLLVAAIVLSVFRINTPPALTPEQVAAKADAFDFARATNLYLIAAREYGTCLGGHSCTELLFARTDWSLDKCKRLGDRVVDDQAIIKLLEFEGIPEAYENG